MGVRIVRHSNVRADHFFIVGCPRSGTTLLSVCLDRHSRLSVPPETAFFDEVAPLLTRRTTPERLADILRWWPRLAELNLGVGRILERIARWPVASGDVLAAMLELYAEAQGKPRCGEKTPRHLMHVPTILELFPGAKIVCMLRDGREAALSLNAMPWWAPNDLRAAARVWRRSARLARRFTVYYPEQFLVVRYENLVANPEAVLSSVMAYLGEAYEPQQLQPQTPSHVVLPRSRGWKEQACGPIDPASVGRRQAEATPAQRATLERMLGRTLRRCGYGESAISIPPRADPWTRRLRSLLRHRKPPSNP